MQKILTIMTILLTLLLVFVPIHALAQTSETQEILLRSEAAVLMDADSGQILFAKEMQRIMYPASITKVVTAMLALQLAKPQDVITMSQEAVFPLVPTRPTLRWIPANKSPWSRHSTPWRSLRPTMPQMA